MSVRPRVTPYVYFELQTPAGIYVSIAVSVTSRVAGPAVEVEADFAVLE